MLACTGDALIICRYRSHVSRFTFFLGLLTYDLRAYVSIFFLKGGSSFLYHPLLFGRDNTLTRHTLLICMIWVDFRFHSEQSRSTPIVKVKVVTRTTISAFQIKSFASFTFAILSA